jgi:predicted PurR-regulated permease PerM
MGTKKMAASIANDWGSRSHIKTLVLMGATACGVYFCYRLVVPFLPMLAWTLALAVLFTPFQRWLESKLKRPSLAAAVSVLVIVLIVAVPATFVGQRLTLQAVKGAQLVKAKVESGDWRRAIESRPRIALLADRIEQQIDLPGTVTSFTNWLTNTAGSLVKGSVVQVIGFFLTFYLLFFFLRDRRAALQSLRSLSPLSEVEMDRLFSRIGDTIYATIYGTLAVSAAQGLLGGLMFWWLGLSAPLLWGVVMALLAVVPVLGAFVVWIPAALFLAMEGSWGKAIILSVWGGVVVGSIDNLLRPVLVGKRLKLHTVLVFISVVGGLLVFGASGLILGPVVLTVTTVLLETWRSRNTVATMARIDPEPDESFRFENENGPEATEPVLPLPRPPGNDRAKSGADLPAFGHRKVKSNYRKRKVRDASVRDGIHLRD